MVFVPAVYLWFSFDFLSQEDTHPITGRQLSQRSSPTSFVISTASPNMINCLGLDYELWYYQTYQRVPVNVFCDFCSGCLSVIKFWFSITGTHSSHHRKTSVSKAVTDDFCNKLKQIAFMSSIVSREENNVPIWFKHVPRYISMMTFISVLHLHPTCIGRIAASYQWCASYDFIAASHDYKVYHVKVFFSLHKAQASNPLFVYTSKAQLV